MTRSLAIRHAAESHGNFGMELDKLILISSAKLTSLAAGKRLLGLRITF